MARNKAKTAEETKNPYKKARLQAAEQNPELSTAEKASEIVDINRERLGQIEQDERGYAKADPRPDEVARMVRAYNAPELQNIYCTQLCPLGSGKPVLEYRDINGICLHLLLALQRVNQAQADLAEILEDGDITVGEKKEFRKLLKTLKSVSKNTESLELWAKKNGILTEDA